MLHWLQRIGATFWVGWLASFSVKQLLWMRFIMHFICKLLKFTREILSENMRRSSYIFHDSLECKKQGKNCVWVRWMSVHSEYWWKLAMSVTNAVSNCNQMKLIEGYSFLKLKNHQKPERIGIGLWYVGTAFVRLIKLTTIKIEIRAWGTHTLAPHTNIHSPRRSC